MLVASSLHLESLLAESMHVATVLVPLLAAELARLSVLHSSSRSISLSAFQIAPRFFRGRPRRVVLGDLLPGVDELLVSELVLAT